MQTKPILNTTIKDHPEDTYVVMFLGAGSSFEGKDFKGQPKVKWRYDVLWRGSEYTYFVDNEYHNLDIDRQVERGNVQLHIRYIPAGASGNRFPQWKADLVDTPEIASQPSYNLPTTSATTNPSQTAPSASQVVTSPSAKYTSATAKPSSPNWDEISKGKCRHAYALEIFKGLIAEKKPLEITPQIAMVIDTWTDYSMNGVLPLPVVQFDKPQSDENIPL